MKSFIACICLFVTSVISGSTLLAQDAEANQPGRNIFRTNLTSIAFRNYDIQYERMLSKRISLGLGYRSMPSGSILFKDFIINSIENSGTPGDVDIRESIESITMSNYAITPEVRFYAGKRGYGHGFYLSLFFRHANHKLGNISVDYADNAGNNQTVKLTGSLTSNTAGFMLGSQWVIGNRVALDWWIIGPHYGVGTGTLTGRNSSPINSTDQNSLRSEIDEVLSGLPFGDKVVKVDANGASVSLSGPWAGLRAGISIGIRL